MLHAKENAGALDGNWKQHAWNYLDAFHIPFIHRGPEGLIDAIDYKSYTTEIYDHAVLQWAWAKDPAHGLKPEHTPERLRHADKRVFALWYFLWPNLTLNSYPWGSLSKPLWHRRRFTYRVSF